MAWSAAGMSFGSKRDRTARGARRLVALAMAPVQGVLSSVPAVATTAVVAATAAVVAGPAAPARASMSGSVLILSTSVNGGTSSAEAQQATALGLTVTVDTPTQWDALTQPQFASYSAIVIGDSSASSCATTVPSDAVSTAGTWGPAIAGNVAVLGTAPALAGASTLIQDAIAYAASGSGTGLYVSLNCEYSSASAGTSVPLLASVDGGGGFTVTGQSANCPSAAGTVNTWREVVLAQFNGLTSGDLGPWSSPACSVEETFNSWPAGPDGLGYYPGAAPATFTASDGATGQAYILAGPAAVTTTSQNQNAMTAALAPSTGGQVPAGAAAGGAGNAAAPGVNQAAADGVNTENGDYAMSATDVSIPTFGPSLSFSRTYDAQLAQQQSQTGTPGQMGYGWTDNWASSLTTASPVPGDIYTLDGLRSPNGNGGAPTSEQVGLPGYVITNGGNVYIADTHGNRVLEVPGSSGTQWGISMTAGDTYMIAGDSLGRSGCSASGGGNGSFWLASPSGLAFDSSGNLYISDSGNDRVLELAASGGTFWNIPMAQNHVYRVAGAPGCTPGSGPSPEGTVATQSNLLFPIGIKIDNGDLYIADSGYNRVVEDYGGGSTWGQSMTTNDLYTVAGSSSGTPGNNGAGGAATSALLTTPSDISFSSGGDLYIAVTGNNKIQEVAKSTGAQWGLGTLTANDIYNIVGDAHGASGTCSNGALGPGNTSCLLNAPSGIVVNNGTNLYVADSGNADIEEVAQSGHSEWGISMTQYDLYRIAGTGAAGFSGDGGAATSAKLSNPETPSVGSSSMYVADTGNDRVRLVDSSDVISEYAGTGYGIADIGDGGPAIDAGLQTPQGEVFDKAGDIFIADANNNRIQEIAASDHTQYGINMTAGDVYTIAGSPIGAAGFSGDGGSARSALLHQPISVAMDASGNLYVADSLNCRIRKITTSGTISTVAGNGTCQGNGTGSGVTATSAVINAPQGVAVDPAGDIYIADTFNNRVEEVYASGGQSFGQSMTAGKLYFLAGSPSATAGASGGGGASTAALLYLPDALGIDGAGNLYISEYGNNRIEEIPVSTGTQHGKSMTQYHIYTIAGPNSDACTGSYPSFCPHGNSGDGGPATAALMNGPGNATADAAGDVYITDIGNNRVREVPAANGTQWGQAMTANDIYNVAGSAAGDSGNSGDGGPATSALFSTIQNVSLDSAGDMYVTDGSNSRLREVISATPATITPAPGQASALYPAPGGITVTQPGGAQVTFYAQSGGQCPTLPYTLVAGQYCALPQDVGSSLTYNSSSQVWTFTPQPGTTLTYSASGLLTGESDAAGDTLSVTYGVAHGSGNCPVSAAWCQVITSASGRTLTLGYNNASPVSQVTSVTDPLGRQWTYAYSGSDLASVTDARGNVTSYAYDSSNTNPLLVNDLLTITAPNGQVGGPDAGTHTTLAWDTTGRVTSITDPMGYLTSYDFSGFNSSTGTGIVKVTDPDGNATVYDYSQASLAAQSTWNGAVGTTLLSEQDFAPDQTASSTDPAAGTQLDTATADGNANITTTSYDTNPSTGLTNGNPIAVTAPDGIGTQLATTTQQSTSLDRLECTASVIASSTCSQNPGPSPVTPGGVITPPSNAPAQGLSYAQYDTSGNQLYITTGVYEPGSSTAAYSQTTYQLFQGNSVTLNGNNITCSATPPSPSLPCATINSDGVVTQLGYDSQGDLTSSSTPDGNPANEMATTTYGYDGDGEQTSMTSPDGNLPGANAGNYTTITTWNADSQKTAVSRGDGTGHTVTPRTTNYSHDADGNQTTTQDPRGFTTTTTFNADDQATLVENPDSNSMLTCYDGTGHVTQTVPPVGVAAGNLTGASCPTSYPSGYGTRLASDATTYTYNGLGQKTQMTAPAPAGQSGSETTSYTYDANGNLIQTTAPPTTTGGPNQVTVDSYTSTGQLASVTTGYGTSAASTISYCYDPDGDETASIYADGNVSGVAPCEISSPWVVNPASYPTQASYQTAYSYDSENELVSGTAPATAADPNGATTTYTYDPEGNTLTSTDPSGVTITRTYTPDDHPASVTYSGSAAHSVTYRYDAEDNIIAMTDATGTSSNVYDPFGEVTSATNGAGQVTGYGYNADGQVSSVTYPLPSNTWATTSTVNYTHDNADLLTKFTDFNGNSITIGSTADGLPNSVALGSTGDTISTTYGSTDMPSAIALKNSSSTLQSFTYTDSPAGTILNETDTPTSSQSPAVYTYDAKSRVVSMTPGTGSTLTYGFDASSNLTTLPTGASGTYDKAGELTSSTLSGTTTNYTYNADGQRLTSAQGSTITSGTWNGAGELTSYTSPAGSMTSTVYDGNGLRASASESMTTQNFVWGDGTTLLQDSTNAYIYGASATPAEQVNLATGTVVYLNTDALGSVRGIVSTSGSLTESTSYDAWGNPAATGGLTSTTPFGYAGGYTDPDGLIYLISRYYDPQTGQFLSVDPDLSQTNDPYGYAAGDPVNVTDPTGAHPKGLGYFFVIGRTFTWREGEAFVSFLLGCGATCPTNYYLHTPYGPRFVDVYDPDINWLNEVKTGFQPFNSGLGKQVKKDNWLVWQGHNACDAWPCSGATWWFLPSSRTKLSGSNFYQRLSNYGINIMLFIYRRRQNDSDYQNAARGNYAMEAAAESYEREPEVYDYFPQDEICPAAPFWVQ